MNTPTMADLLRDALRLTERALSGPFSAVEAKDLLVARAPLIERAAALGPSTTAGDEERTLARLILELDGRAVELLALESEDARRWLERREEQRS